MTDISHARILILATDGFEQSELLVPLKALRDKGANVTVAAPAKTQESGKIRAWDGEASQPDWGESVPVDQKLDEVDPAGFDALVLPGGVINPDKLRTEPKAIELIRRFSSDGKVIAAICHGPWLLAEAGVIKGRNVTSFTSIKTDMKNAGGLWQDNAVVTDAGFITSRNPGDLPAFVAKIVEEIGEGNHARKRQAA